MNFRIPLLSDKPITISTARSSVLATVAVSLFCGYYPGTAGVVDPQVVAGAANFSYQGATTTVTTSDVAIINYRQFGVAANETLQFVQPAADSRVLNRVAAGANPSEILGNLYANGRVFIVNPAGVLFGANSVVDAGQIYAAAGQISDADFLAGQLRFDNLTGSVLNEGTISAETVALIGRHIANSGIIDAPDGTIAIVAGDSVYLGSIDGGIYVQIDNASDIAGPAIENSGTLDAGDGVVRLEAGDFYSLAIKQSGVLRGGDIDLTGGEGSHVALEGQVVIGVDQPGSLVVRADSVSAGAVISGVAGGSAILDPDVLDIGAAEALTATTALESDLDFDFAAENEINLNAPIDTTAGPPGLISILSFSDEAVTPGLRINLNADISLQGTQGLTGQATVIGLNDGGDLADANFLLLNPGSAELDVSANSTAGWSLGDLGNFNVFTGSGTNVLSLAGGADSVTISGSKAGSVSGLDFTGVQEVDGLGGADDLTNASGLVYAAADNTVADVTISNFEAVDTPALSLTTGDDTFAHVGGAAAFDAGLGSINYTGLTSVDALAGTDKVELTAGDDIFTVTGANAGSDGTIAFTNIEEVDALAETTADSLVNSAPAAVYAAADNTVAGITATNFEAVDTPALSLTTGDDTFAHVAGAATFDAGLGSISYTGLTSVDALGGTDKVELTGGNDSFTVSAANTGSDGTIAFTNIEQVDALTGSGDVIDNQTGNPYAAGSSSVGSVAFSNFETINTPAVELTAGDDAFTVTGANAGSFGAEVYTGLTAVDAAAGTADSLLNSSGQVFAAATTSVAGVTASNFEAVNTPSLSLTTGDDTITTGTVAGEATFGGINYSSLTSVDALAGTDTVELTANDDTFTVTAANAGTDGTISFTQIEEVDALAQAAADTLVNSSGQVFAAATTSVAGVTASNFEAVSTPSLSLTTGNDTFTVSAVAGEATFGGIDYSGLTSVDALAGSDTVELTANDDTFTVSAANAGTEGTIAFTQIEEVDALGQLIADTLTNTSGQTFLGATNSVAGVTATNFETVSTSALSLTTGADTLTLGVAPGTASFNSINFIGLTSVDALAGVDTIQGSATADNFVLTGDGAGSVKGFTFTSFANLYGNDGNDTFTLNADAAFNEITGGLGDDVFTLGTADPTDENASYLLTITEQLKGDGGSDSLIQLGLNSSTSGVQNDPSGGKRGNATQIDRTTSGREFGTMEVFASTIFSTGNNLDTEWFFSDDPLNPGTLKITYQENGGPVEDVIGTFEGIEGGSLADTFNFDFAYAGFIRGSGGTDTLQGSLIDAVLLELATADGFSGSENSIFGGASGGFSGIDVINGTGTTSLAGLDGDAIWEISATPSYTSGGFTLAFSGVSSLLGGIANDAFQVDGGNTEIVSIDGGAGAGVDILAGRDDAPDTFTLSLLALTLDTAAELTTIADIEQLHGRGDADAFVVEVPSNYVLSGGAGSDTLQGSLIDDVVLTAVDADGFSGTEADTGGFAGVDILTGNGSAQLTGLGADATWEISASPSYAVAGGVLDFSGVATLQGGSANDTFQIDGGNTEITMLDGGTGTDTLAGRDDAADTFTLNGGVTLDTAAEITSIAGIEKLAGRGGADSFIVSGASAYDISAGEGADTFTVNAVLTGSLDGQAGTDALVGSLVDTVVLTSATVDGYSGTEASVTGGFAGIDRIDANGAGSLTGLNTAGTWNLGLISSYTSGAQVLNFTGFTALQGGSAADAFTVSGVALGNLSGGAGDDSFTINNTLIGSIDGQGGIDTLNSTSSLIDDVTLTAAGANGFAGTETDIAGGFAGIDAIAGNGSARLVGLDANATWAMDGTPTYTSGANVLAFNDFTKLQGGTQADTFTISAPTTASITGGTGDDVFTIGAVLSGSLDGEGGNDTLAGSQIDAVVLTSAGLAGFSGTEASISGGFAGINTLAGNGSASLTGLNATSIWALDGTPTYSSGLNVLAFSGVTSMQGGSAADTFTVSAATAASLSGGAGDDTFAIEENLTGSVAGQAGLDTLQGAEIDDVALTSADASGFAGTESSVSGGFAGIDVLAANGAATLTGLDAASTWSLDGTPTYTSGANSLAFSGVDTIEGGANVDQVTVSVPTTMDILTGDGDDVVTIDAALTGLVDGEGGSDTLKGLVVDTVVLTTADGDGYAGTEASISGGFAGIDTLSGTGTGSLTGLNAAATWSLDGTPTYTSGAATLGFSGFPVLQGGTNADAFAVTAPTIADLIGGAGDDTFTVDAPLTGKIDGETGIDTLNGTQINAIVLGGSDANGYFGQEDSVTNGFAGIDSIVGNGAASFTGLDVDSNWEISATPSYTSNLITLELSGIASMLGGTANDTFQVEGGNTQITAISGGAGIGIDTLAGRNDLEAETFTIAGGSVSLNSAPELTSITGIENLDGRAGNDTFQVTSASTFNLAGGANDDTFLIAGVLTGTLDGGAGADQIAGSLIDSVVLTSPGADGFAGTEDSITGGFSGIDDIAGNGSATLQGLNFAATWNVAATSSYTSGADVLAFSGMTALIGGTANDDFILGDGGVASSLIGGTGTNTVSVTGDFSGDQGFSAKEIATFSMNDGSGITATEIDINATGDVTVASLEATGTGLSITSGGAILDGGDTDVDIVGGIVTLTAANGIGSANALETTISTLTAGNSTQNNIGIVETDALTIESVINPNGNVSISAGGAISDGDAAVDLVAGTATLVASGGIGAAADALDTDVTTLSATDTGGGDIWINETDALELDLASTTGNVSVTAGGAISDSDAAVDLIASTATLTAVGGIGSTNSIETTITTLAAVNTGGGAIRIDETNDLTLDTVDNGTGEVSLTAGGAIIDGGDARIDIVAGSTVLVAASGIGSGNAIDTTITTLSATNTASGTIEINESDALALDTVDNGTRDITLTAGGAISDGGNANIDIRAGTANIVAVGGIGSGNTLETSIVTLNATNTGGGSVEISDDSSLALDTVDNGTGAVVITANGAITDAGDNNTDLVAGTAVLTAVGGIGSTDALDTTITTLTATNTGGGAVQINEADDLALDTVDNGTDTVSLTAGGALINALTSTTQVVAGQLTLTAANGIGDPNPLLFTIDRLTATNTASGAISIGETDGFAVDTIDNGDRNVTISMGGGGVADGGDENVDIIAGSLYVEAVDGIGSGDPLETLITHIDASNIFTGSIEIDNGMDLEIGLIDNVGRHVRLTSTGSLTDGWEPQPNIRADSLLLAAVNGIGTGNAIETDVNTIFATNPGAGSIEINELNDLALDTVNAGTLPVILDVGGVITDAGDTNVDLVAGTATIKASSGIGSANAIETTVATLNAFNTAIGDIRISETNDIALDTLNNGGREVYLAAGGMITDGGDANVDIVARYAELSAVGGIGMGDPLDTGIDVLRASNTGAGTIELGNSRNLALVTVSNPDDSVFLTVSGAITDNDDTLVDIISPNVGLIAAGGIGSGNALETTIGDINATNTGSGSIELVETDDIGIAEIRNGTGMVSVTAGGAITDVGGPAVNIVAGETRLAAASGIGSGDALETTIASIRATNSISGTIEITETDAVAIDTLDNGDRDVVLLAGGAVTDAGDASVDVVAGTATVVATGGIGSADALETTVASLDARNTGGGAIRINETDSVDLITIDNGTGDVSLAAGGAITGTDDTRDDVVAGTATLTAVSGIGLADRLDTRIGTLSAVNTGNGSIGIEEADDLNIVTVDNGDRPISLISLNGAITDGDDTLVDLVGGEVLISAVNGIGSGNALETTITSVEATNTTAGSIELVETDNIGIVNVVNGTSLVAVTAGGAITDANGSAVNIAAGEARLAAATGIGSGDAIETEVVQLAATNTTSGTIEITDQDDLALNTVDNATRDVVLVSGGQITDNNGDAFNVIAGEMTLLAQTGIGSGDAIETNIVGLLNLINTQDGDVRIREWDGLVIGDQIVVNQGGTGDIEIIVQTGELTINSPVSASGGDVTLVAESGTVNLNNTVGLDNPAYVGNITVTGDRVDQNGTIVTNGAGTITVTADVDGINMSSQSVARTSAGAITYTASSGNINIGLLETSGTATVIANSGGIVDGNAVVPNVIAGTAILQGATGIGSGNPLETSIGLLTASNSASGNIEITESGDISLDTVSNPGRTVVISAGGGIIDGGDSNVDVVAGTAVLTAVSGIGTGNALETTIGTLTAVNPTSGTIEIAESDDLALETVNNATRAVILTVTGAVTDAGDTNVDLVAGNVTLSAGKGIGSGNAIESTTTVLNVTNSTSGSVEFNETDTLTINSITNGDRPVILTAAQAIEENGDAEVDIVAGKATLKAATGIGSGNALETTVAELAATNTASGNIEITESDSLALDTVNNGTRSVVITAGGAISDAGDASVDLVAGAATLTASGGIGSGNALETTLTSIRATNAGQGAIQISETDSLAVDSVDNADREVALSAGAAITDGGDERVDIVAGVTTLTAATGIGSGNALETTISGLSATNSGSGSVEIVETDSLEVAGASAPGNIVLLAGASMVQTGAISSGATVDLGYGEYLEIHDASITATGNILLNALDAEGSHRFAGGDPGYDHAAVLGGNTVRLPTIRISDEGSGNPVLLSAGQGLVLGRSETINANASVTIEGGDHRVGDMNIRGALTITGDSLTFLERTPFDIDETANERLDTTDVVARSVALNLASQELLILNTAGTESTTQNFVYFGVGDGFTFNGIQTSGKGGAIARFQQSEDGSLFVFETTDFLDLENFQDLQASGSIGDNVAEELAGAIPEFELVILPEGSLDAAVLELLQQIGIFARPSTRQEAVSLQEAYSVFVQSLVEPNEREFYYQPSRDAFRRLLEVVFLTQPKNYEVAERRVSRARVDRALALYYEAFWNLDDDLNPVSPRTDALVQILQSAFEGYAATTESPNGPGFAAYVRNRGGAAASEMERLRKLFSEIRSLGLTRQEREVSYRVLLAPISGFGLPTADLIEALQEPEIANQMALNP